MKLSIRNYRGVERADIEIAPIALVAARNGGGKTSTIQAMQAAALRKAVMVPGGTIKEAGRFVRRGADGGSITLTGSAGSVTIGYPKCKVGEDGTGPRIGEIAAGLVRISGLKPADRAAALAPFMPKAKPTKDDLAAAMRDAGYSAESVEKTWASIEARGWDALHKDAAEHGTKLKGKWEATTGETWGSEKAKTWRPAGWSDAIAATAPEDLAKAAALADDALLKALSAGAVGEHEAAALREKVLAAEHVDLTAREEAVTEAASALENAQAARRGLPAVADNAQPCPHCGRSVLVDQPYKGAPVLKVAAIEAVDAATLKARRLAIADADGTVERLKGEMTDAETALSQARRIIADGEAAAAKLETQAGAGTQNLVDEARAALAAANEAVRIRKAGDEAAGYFAAWVKNAALVAAVGPDGLRKAAMARALGDLNTALKACSEPAGWGTVRIDEALDLWLGAEAFADLSESLQFRVDVTVQVALAAIEQAECVLIDRADMLDSRGRNGLFNMLVAAGLPALVAMTANKAALVPDLGGMEIGRTYWIENGVAEEVGGQAAEKAA